ncbi:MAG: 1-(5-phosphoribosyl)-5-[(5-phosphoribosylamino)methylideneamino] imidazole-4-carboxamide isomerase [Chloroflexota bacterium]
MELIAAIDLYGEGAVRLRQGDHERPVAQVPDPVSLAREWAAAGVPRLHLVDLEGARSGGPTQLEQIKRVVAAARGAAPAIRVQAGGGLRTVEAVAAVLEAGVDQAILGTAALEAPGTLAACAEQFPGRVLASLDLRGGRLAVSGWERDADEDPLRAANRLLQEGAAGLIVTDAGRDGTLVGPNVRLMERFRETFPHARLLAAGGVASIDDLLALRRAGIDGAIVGLALLTGAVQLQTALAALAAEEVSA